MEPLTRQQEEIYRGAFNCISRVAAMHYSVNNPDEIKVSFEKKLFDIPVAIRDIIRSSGGLYKLSTRFCEINRRETTQQLIKKCYSQGINPANYLFHGLLTVQKIKVTEYTFSDHKTRASA